MHLQLVMGGCAVRLLVLRCLASPLERPGFERRSVEAWHWEAGGKRHDVGTQCLNKE